MKRIDYRPSSLSGSQLALTLSHDAVLSLVEEEG